MRTKKVRSKFRFERFERFEVKMTHSFDSCLCCVFYSQFAFKGLKAFRSALASLKGFEMF